MFSKAIATIALSICITWSFAQHQDSITFAKTKWKKEKVASQVKLYRFHFEHKELFGANENISFLEVKNSGRKAIFALAGDEKKLIETSDFGKQKGAFAAINGNFFDVKNGGSVDFVKIDGQVINQNRYGKDGQRARHQQAAVVINRGKIALKVWDNTPDWEQKLPEDHVLLNGPLLLLNDQALSLDTAGFNRLRHPRTCMGIKPNGRVILFTVDGRNEQSDGMSLFELTKIMRWLGCTSALNFDGGGSTTLWVDGYPDGGIINYPTDNKKWDHAGARKVANAVLLKKL